MYERKLEIENVFLPFERVYKSRDYYYYYYLFIFTFGLNLFICCVPRSDGELALSPVLLLLSPKQSHFGTAIS